MPTALRRVALGFAGLVGLLLLVAAAGAAVGSRKLARTYAVTPAALTLPSDSASVARGAHLASIYGCRDCHGDDLAGRVMEDAPPFRIVASNLTPAGAGADYAAPADWDRAVRHGVRPDGRAMFIMPSGAYHEMSDAEAATLVAYLQSLAPVDNALPRTEWREPGRLIAAVTDWDASVHPEPTRATSPSPGATVAYGRYLSEMLCSYCHGETLAGAQPEAPGSPLAPDLRAAGRWTPEQFHRTLTTGVTPAGRQMDPDFMPWTATAQMTPAEREGIRLYLASLTAAGD